MKDLSDLNAEQRRKYNTFMSIKATNHQIGSFLPRRGAVWTGTIKSAMARYYALGKTFNDTSGIPAITDNDVADLIAKFGVRKLKLNP